MFQYGRILRQHLVLLVDGNRPTVTGGLHQTCLVLTRAVQVTNDKKVGPVGSGKVLLADELPKDRSLGTSSEGVVSLNAV